MGDADIHDGLIGYIDYKFENYIFTFRFYPIVDDTKSFVMYNNGTISEVGVEEFSAVLDDMVRNIYIQEMGYDTEILPGDSIIYNGQKASYSIGG